MKQNKSKKYKSAAYEIAAYQKKNKSKLTATMLAHNPDLRDTSEKTLYTLFKQDVMSIKDDDKTTVKKAIKAELRTRAFKSQEEFYQESILTNLKENKDMYKQLRNDMRIKGKFASIDVIKYNGKVTIDGTQYSKYIAKNAIGTTRYIYESNSPKSDSYDLFVSEINYE